MAKKHKLETATNGPELVEANKHLHAKVRELEKLISSLKLANQSKDGELQWLYHAFQQQQLTRTHGDAWHDEAMPDQVQS